MSAKIDDPPATLVDPDRGLQSIPSFNEIEHRLWCDRLGNAKDARDIHAVLDDLGIGISPPSTLLGMLDETKLYQQEIHCLRLAQQYIRVALWRATSSLCP